MMATEREESEASRADEARAVERATGEMAIGVAEARASFERKRAAIEAVGEAELVSIKVDVRRMAAMAHSLAMRDAAPARRAVFERMAAAGFYDLATLDDLPELARGAWYARQQQLFGVREGAGAGTPEEVVRRCYDVRGRMLSTLEHWLSDDEQVGARLRSIREGSGRLDLASDLEALAALYAQEPVRHVISIDHKHYRASDAPDAVLLAAVLFAGLGVGKESAAARWASLARRATTLMVRCYEAHRRCGQFAFFDDEDVAVTYPSLVAAVRNGPSKRASAEPAEAEVSIVVA